MMTVHVYLYRLCENAYSSIEHAAYPLIRINQNFNVYRT